jgi:hypothetical protein
VARRPRGPQRFRLTCRAPSSVYCVVLLCGSCEAEHLAKRTSLENLKKRITCTVINLKEKSSEATAKVKVLQL